MVPRRRRHAHTVAVSRSRPAGEVGGRTAAREPRARLKEFQSPRPGRPVTGRQIPKLDIRPPRGVGCARVVELRLDRARRQPRRSRGRHQPPPDNDLAGQDRATLSTRRAVRQVVRDFRHPPAMHRELVEPRGKGSWSSSASPTTSSLETATDLALLARGITVCGRGLRFRDRLWFSKPGLSRDRVGLHVWAGRLGGTETPDVAGPNCSRLEQTS